MPTRQQLTVHGTTVETPLLTVKVDPKSGHVTRIFDKRSGDGEVLPRGAKANALKIYLEKPHGMSAWDSGPVTAVHMLDEAELVRVTEQGPVRATIEGGGAGVSRSSCSAFSSTATCRAWNSKWKRTGSNAATARRIRPRCA